MRLFKRISSKEERERLEKERQLQLQKRDVPVVRIEILSDTVCPYCYIMKHRLEKAVREFEVRRMVFSIVPFRMHSR